MILILILSVLTIIGIIVMVCSKEYSSVNTTGFFMTAIFGSCLIFALVLLPIFYYSTKAEVNRYYALKETIEVSRNSDISELERATLASEIAKYNKDLASIKFWNDTIFDIYIYDGLAELEYLK